MFAWRTCVCWWSSLLGDLSKRSYPVFTRVSKKTTEISERLDRLTRSWNELGNSHLPVLSAELLRHWWGRPLMTRNNTLPEILYYLTTWGIYVLIKLLSFISYAIYSLLARLITKTTATSMQLHSLSAEPLRHWWGVKNRISLCL